jgi:hypothetical protein
MARMRLGLPRATTRPCSRRAHSRSATPRPFSFASATWRLKSERSGDGTCMSAAQAVPRARRSTPSRLPCVRSASPQRDSRTAHSNSGSMLPATVALPAASGCGPAEREASQRASWSGANSSFAPARVWGMAPLATRS